MGDKKRGFIPLFSIFQTEHPVLLTAITVLTIIIVAMFPALLPVLLVAAIIVGIIGLFAVFTGLIDMNRESLAYSSNSGKFSFNVGAKAAGARFLYSSNFFLPPCKIL